jgi:flagellar hook-associated protein 3 FlgL
MRISTAQFHNRALDGMLTQQANLSKTQSQVASGKRIENPSDDPIGAVHILELQRAKAESNQFARNSDVATARLNTEELALGDTTLLLQRVRELVIQVNNPANDDSARKALASELTARTQELLDIANRRDASGEYLFSGYATTTQPFARSGSAVAYAGDQGNRLIQTGPTQRVVDGHSGYEVFQNIQQGNGTFVTGVNNANTGSGVITTGSVVTPASWVPETYTITFTAPDTYQITNSAATVIVAPVAGNYVSGNGIAFNGVQVSVSGAPAAGDTFTVAQSQKEDIFTTLDKIVAAVQTANDSSMSRAQLASKVNVALEQLDRSDSHLQTVRSEIGSRLSLLDSTQASRADFDLELERNLSNLQDIDYAEAISRMNRQYIGLQAAQQSYATLAQMSLFNYL